MPDTTNKTPSKEDAEKHLTKIEKELEQFAGKAGHNPFFKLKEIAHLRGRLGDPESRVKANALTADCGVASSGPELVVIEQPHRELASARKTEPKKAPAPAPAKEDSKK